MGSGTFLTVGYFEYLCCTSGYLPVMGVLRVLRVWICASPEAHRVSHVLR